MANTSEIKAFCQAPIDAMFGLTTDELWKKIPWSNTATSRFYYWCQDNESQVKAVWKKCQEKGVSPVWFTAYEFVEGYNPSLNWLNHFQYRPPLDPVGDCATTCEWIVSTSKNPNLSPAWDDPFGGTVGMVPQSVRNNGNAEYAKWGLGTIGHVYGAGTAAAAWAIWYPQGLKAEYNGVQNYGNPLAQCVDLIKSWGGSLSSYGAESSPTQDNNTGSNNIANSTTGILNGLSSVFSNLLNSVDSVLDELFKEIMELFTKSLSAKSPVDYFSNGILTIKNVYKDRLVKVGLEDSALQNIIDKASQSFKHNIVNAQNASIGTIGQITTDKNNAADGNLSGGTPTPPSAGGSEPAKIRNALNQSAGEVGKWGGQCYRYAGLYLSRVTGRQIYYGLGGTMLPLRGEGARASLISTDWDWSGVATSITSQPTEGSQIKSGDIFTIDSYQSNWGTGVWGHVGFVDKVENGTVYYYESNYNSTELVYYHSRTVANFLAGCNALIHLW